MLLTHLVFFNFLAGASGVSAVVLGDVLRISSEVFAAAGGSSEVFTPAAGSSEVFAAAGGSSEAFVG